MDTAFDDLYQTKKEETRKEKIPLISLIHQVPKQVADTAQAVGVSEKFLANGIPSGVLGPSQIAHDRYLSFMDGVQDAFLVSLLLVLFPLVSFNLFTGPVYIVGLLYWVMHLYWWEKTRAWYIKTSVKRYINNTYRVYVWTLILASMALMGGLIYFFVTTAIEMKVQGFVNGALNIVEGAEKALHASFPNAGFAANPEYYVKIAEKAYDTRFYSGLGGFLLITLGFKVLFASKSRRERLENEGGTQEELDYRGESALRVIRERA